ncbi:MAG: GHMP kinase [Bacteriovoracia bacterium]
MHIESRAPIRIDLAGGTLDIWPLYLLIPHATTVNVGIDMYAQAFLRGEPSDRDVFVLRSEDLNAQAEIPVADVYSATVGPALDLHLRLLRHFLRQKKDFPSRKPQRVTLSTKAKSPAGAGLGGSSALNIALCGALDTWVSERKSLDIVKEGERLIGIARDVESQVLKVPAGLQDYYGAMYGGLQAIQWAAGEHHRRWLDPAILKELSARLVLFYSGKSRNSGINNWHVYKSVIDQEPTITARLRAIAEATSQLEKNLSGTPDWTAAVASIADEWKARRELAQGISTPEMETAFAAGEKLGARAYKVCGAGGGGCFFLMTEKADEALRQKLVAQIPASAPDIRHLPFQAVNHGLEVQVHA